MRLIYTDGFGEHERKEVRQVIFANMIVAFKIIGEEMRDLGLDYEYKESSVCLRAPFNRARLTRYRNLKQSYREPKI